jgi:hypothetical protein
MNVNVVAVDAPNATCDPGELSDPTFINLHIEDDDGDVISNGGGKTIQCEGGQPSFNVKMDRFFQGPLNCAGSVDPVGNAKTTGLAPTTATGSFGTPPVVQDTLIKCRN